MCDNYNKLENTWGNDVCYIPTYRTDFDRHYISEHCPNLCTNISCDFGCNHVVGGNSNVKEGFTTSARTPVQITVDTGLVPPDDSSPASTSIVLSNGNILWKLNNKTYTTTVSTTGPAQ